MRNQKGQCPCNILNRSQTLGITLSGFYKPFPKGKLKFKLRGVPGCVQRLPFRSETSLCYQPVVLRLVWTPLMKVLKWSPGPTHEIPKWNQLLAGTPTSDISPTSKLCPVSIIRTLITEIKVCQDYYYSYERRRSTWNQVVGCDLCISILTVHNDWLIDESQLFN